MRFALLFILLFSAPAYSNDICTPKALLSKFFKIRPDDIQWNKDLRGVCTVTNQKFVPTCGIHSSTGVIDGFLKKIGAFTGDEHLNVQYYEALHMKEAILDAARNNDPITVKTLGGLDLHDTFDYVFKKGVVTEREFSFPKLKHYNDDGVYYHTFNEDPHVRDMVLERLESVKRDPVQLKELLTKYFGDTDAIQPRVIKPSVQRKLIPSLYSTQRFKRYIPYTHRRKIASNFDLIEKEIRRSLDADVPVTINAIETEAIHAAGESATTFAKHGPLDEFSKTGHAMKIIGYHLKDGRVDWFLVQNSWGSKWGSKGTFTMSRDYAEHHGAQFHIYDADQIDW